MAGKFSFNEQVDMILVLGFCEGNCRRSVVEYRRRFPNRVIPNRQTFANVERKARETGSLCQRINGGRIYAVNARNEERILRHIENEPQTSTRRISRQFNIPQSTVHRVIRRNMLHPYHYQKVQELLPQDLEPRMIFCNFILNQNVFFHRSILFTDEACFTRRGITNLHNSHEYSNQNPHITITHHYQREFKINVWAGILGRYLVGPVILPNRLNGASYLLFLQNTLPELLEDLPLQLRLDMWYMHDGAPPHFSMNVREFLNQQFPNRWIGRGNNCPQRWPPRSPDLNKCDYFLWGTLKDFVYSTPVETREDLWNRISNKCTIIKNDIQLLDKVDFNFRRRVHLCLRENGGHFEQHL